MRKTYGTIITNDYIHYALTLNESLLTFDSTAQLKVLITDTVADFSAVTSQYPNTEIYFVDQLCQEGIGKKIYKKYAATDKDRLRWSIKPVFINFLLDQNYDQVFLLDSDLYFFAPFDFLSKVLDRYGVLLTPHWRASNPQLDEKNFTILQTDGLFNAGFIGATKLGRPAMQWWAAACDFKCSKEPHKGFFDDQAYLNLLPIYFDHVEILRHRGCNIANWNQIECERTLSASGKVKIKPNFEVVFIHFTKSTIQGIESGRDYLLRPYLEKYLISLEKHKRWVELSTKVHVAKQNTLRIRKSRSKPDQNGNAGICDPFLNPKPKPWYLDKYLVRPSILSALKANLSNFEGKLLDIGCGQLPNKTLLMAPPSQVTQYIGLDLENNPIHDNQPDIAWQDGNIPLPDSSVDTAIATEVFEHCPNPELVMHEIRRVLNPGGKLFFTIPFLWPLHEVPYNEYRYTPFSLKRHLANSGFTAIDLKPLGGWDASLAQMLGLWLRRRPLGKRMRWALSSLMLPVVYMLSRWDKRTTAQNQSSSMITGLSGTASKPEINSGVETQ
jgi:SAM-dependent methyltransferase